MELIINSVTSLVAVIGVLAFVVSIITQVFKGVGVLSKVPTDILVLVLSIGLTVIAFVAYMQYIQQVILWYMIIAAIAPSIFSSGETTEASRCFSPEVRKTMQ